jgi:hypothetical protein
MVHGTEAEADGRHDARWDGGGVNVDTAGVFEA